MSIFYCTYILLCLSYFCVSFIGICSKLFNCTVLTCDYLLITPRFACFVSAVVIFSDLLYFASTIFLFYVGIYSFLHYRGNFRLFELTISLFYAEIYCFLLYRGNFRPFLPIFPRKILFLPWNSTFSPVSW